ncbi:MAG: TonB-dependent receptor [Rhodomicrobium sp.]
MSQRNLLEGFHLMSKYILAVLGCTAAAGLCAAPAFAQSSPPSPPTHLPPVIVEQKKAPPREKEAGSAVPNSEPGPASQHEGQHPLAAAPASSTTIASEAIAGKKPATNDTAQLLSGTPGVSLAANGGVSSWPAIHSMADERVKTELDGMLITAACPNHMNPVLSYADPLAVAQVKLYAGITPVSAGGDSIGGTIRVESAAPRFAAGDGVITYGSISVFGRSNGDGISTSGTVSAATSNINVTYTGSWAKSGDYKDGNGTTIDSTLYRTENHKLSLAIRDNTDLLIIEAGVQHIPFEGFPNEYMDMVNNTAWFVNTHYVGQFNWGKLDLRAYYQDTQHEMNLTAEGDKLAYMGGSPMPMYTHGQNFGYSAKAEILESPRDMLRIGSDFHGFLLDDWWPAVPGQAPWMGPNTFWNINGGQRYDLGTFAEWERKWDPQWTTLFGVRNDVVWMNTGNVQGYSNDMNMLYQPDATIFNAENHARTDVNFDATALARYDADLWSTYEGGFSMKTRSPSLYERYDWSTNAMAAMMNGWAGDGNMYVGNIDLKPETAYTFSFSYDWHDGASLKDSGGDRDWQLKITPYYSYVADYIDVRRCGPAGTQLMMMTNCTAANLTATSGPVELIYVNQDAEIFGADIYGRMPLLHTDEYGKFSLVGVAGYDRGINLVTGGGLYHMMPLNAKLTVEHKLGNWSSTAELQLVDAKTDIETVREELQTPGYALVNLRSSYLWGQVRFDLGVENLFNQQYYSPLGGAYLGNAAASNYGAGPFTPLAGMGRNIYAGVTVKF